MGLFPPGHGDGAAERAELSTPRRADRDVQQADPRLQALAARIRTAIDRSPYTQADVARALQVDRSAVARWMTGERTPGLQHLLDLAMLLDIPPTLLLADPAETSPAGRGLAAMFASLDPKRQLALLTLVAPA